MTDLQHMTLEGFIAALGSADPAPGAGAAAGVCLALAAGCAAKAFAISARHAGGPALEEAAAQARRLADAALAGARRDAEDFPALLQAGDDRSAADAVRRDGEALLALGDQLQALLSRYGPATDPVMAGDIGAAAGLLRAAANIQRANLAELAGNP
jgi:formiminotetrahydrofolate cyclodeaminase